MMTRSKRVVCTAPPNDGSRDHRCGVPQVGFDAFYTYFGSDGFTYGSTARNWPKLAALAQRHGLDFIPSVGPGYVDTRVRPWNAQTTRDRDGGRYYDKMWRAATARDVAPRAVTITSWNEWHEGTQIEPAADGARSSGGIDAPFKYLEYTGGGPWLYVDKTARWATEYDPPSRA